MSEPQRFHEITHSTRSYYDGPAAEVYRTIWRDNLHMGTWQEDGDTLHEAMARTNRVMAEKASLAKGDRVLDAGCGYGATARYLARTVGCRVVGVSVGAKELALAAQRARDEGVADRCTFRAGDFQDLPFRDESFDVVFSQEAFLHGADKRRILREAHRVLRPGGRLVFTDLLVPRDLAQADRDRIYARIGTPSIWDASAYETALPSAGFDLEAREDWSPKVEPTYRHVLEALRARRDELAERAGADFVDATLQAYAFWVNAARDGKIGQAFFLARKPA